MLKAVFPVERCCSVLGISVSGFYKSVKRLPSQRKIADESYTQAIELEFESGRGLYGKRRIQARLRRHGQRLGLGRISRIMRVQGLTATRKAKYRAPKTEKLETRHLENHVNREFEAKAANEVWTTDITYIRVDSGWLYLCVILDVYSRRVVGWAQSARVDTNLCSTALWNAWCARGRPKGVIIHSDRGCQYTSEAYQSFCNELNFKQSLSAVGSCYDNAVTESFFSSLKKELIYRLKLLTESEMRLRIFEWIEVYYNRQRIHSTLAYTSPSEYEEFAS